VLRDALRLRVGRLEEPQMRRTAAVEDDTQAEQEQDAAGDDHRKQREPGGFEDSSNLPLLVDCRS
jgi:hypothetical protein